MLKLDVQRRRGGIKTLGENVSLVNGAKHSLLFSLSPKRAFSLPFILLAAIFPFFSKDVLQLKKSVCKKKTELEDDKDTNTFKAGHAIDLQRSHRIS